jgi:alanyl-tRNA synthetase
LPIPVIQPIFVWNARIMTVSEIRQKYIDFFKSRAHVILPSASLVPENDPTTLFTGSGMQPMVPFLLGEPHPNGSRLADSQKCFRSQDIEEVGDNRHTTFFEMLGNWSLGDYFKKEQIEWMFEFLTRELGLDPARLYVTVFAGCGPYRRSRCFQDRPVRPGSIGNREGERQAVCRKPSLTGLTPMRSV